MIDIEGYARKRSWPKFIIIPAKVGGGGYLVAVLLH
jgi:hypothetical protein